MLCNWKLHEIPGAVGENGKIQNTIMKLCFSVIRKKVKQQRILLFQGQEIFLKNL